MKRYDFIVDTLGSSWPLTLTNELAKIELNGDKPVLTNVHMIIWRQASGDDTMNVISMTPVNLWKQFDRLHVNLHAIDMDFAVNNERQMMALTAIITDTLIAIGQDDTLHVTVISRRPEYRGYVNDLNKFMLPHIRKSSSPINVILTEN